jgi:NAD-dependent deacetylase
MGSAISDIPLPTELYDAGSRITILTGAGLSAESGLETFRDKGGIWDRYDLSEVATPEAFARDPAFVLDFYNQRRRANEGVQPNAAHEALARLEQQHGGAVWVITQNIDPLHEMAGARNLIHMHGEIAKALCAECGHREQWGLADITPQSTCPACATIGRLRPDVVWFGEMPYQMERIFGLLAQTDLFISIGTSGTVYPAAGFVEIAREAGAWALELNLEPSEGSSLFHHTVQGRATQTVPALVGQILSGTA